MATVTSLSDSGAGSLRQAITDAAPKDTIDVPAGQIVLTSGPLAIAKDLTIVGAGAGATVISANETSRLVTITAAPVVTLNGMTLTHGRDEHGGAISATGTLTLEHVDVNVNHAGGGGKAGFGGGIEFLGAGALSLLESEVSGNTAGGGKEASGFGGGILYEPTTATQTFALSLLRSRVAGNKAGGGGNEASGFGGGIDTDSGAEGGTISISIKESAVAGNVAGGGTEADGFGGGISAGAGGDKNKISLSIEGSSVSGNTAGGGGPESSGFGGGITFTSGGKEVVQKLTIANSTIAGNVAGGGGPESEGFGAGLEFGGGTATLSHVTVVGNVAGGGEGKGFGGGLSVGKETEVDNSMVVGNVPSNCDNAITSKGHNIDDGTSCGFTGTGDKSSVPALLGPLGEHGGIGPTVMPLAGSPALDAADAATCPKTDERGVARPQGAGCDIGAVEVPPPGVVTGAAASVAPESATLGGSIDPKFSAAKYDVEYGTTTAYGAVSAVSEIGAIGTPTVVSTAVARLQPQRTYHFRLVATNAAGTVTGADQTFTTPQLPRPALSGAKLARKRFRVGSAPTAISAKRAPAGTSFQFNLSSVATVRIAISHSVAGLRRKGRCGAPSARLRHAHAKHCKRRVTVGTLTRLDLPLGSESVAFSGRIGHRALRPGTYVAMLSATGPGGKSKTVSLSFTVVR